MVALMPLRIAGAEASMRGKRLLGPLDLTLGDSGITAVIGPNGSGKTTLLRLMHGTQRLGAGRIGWACPMPEARPHLAFVFQRPVMLRRTVVQNIAYPLRLRGVARGAALARAGEWAARVGLGDHLARRATSLSGGEQQKLALARAFIAAPRVVFLDEPTAALDGAATREVETLLTGARDRGVRLILATHDMGQARRLADDVVFLHRGRVIEHTPAPAFFDTPATPEALAFLKGDILE